jgi:Ca2+/H+ antiporter
MKEGPWVQIWNWISTNVGSTGVVAILLLLLFLWMQSKNHAKAIKYHDKMVRIKEEEVVRITEDRNEYKNFFFDKHLKSSKDDAYSELEKPEEKGEQND